MRQLVIVLLFKGFSIVAVAQGCSDAGFCTIGNLAHRSAEQHLSRQYLKLTLPVGTGDEDVFVFTPAIEYGLQKNRWQFAGKLTANYATGNLGNASGAGDMFLSATYGIPRQKKEMISFTMGTKLPLNGGNLKSSGLSLPMQYQSSVGTIDLIVGLAWNNKRWKIASGWQQPLTGINRNNFLPQYWGDDKAEAYQPSNDFNRKGDLLLRSTYLVVENPVFQLEGGLLGIYHLGEDTYIDANRSIRPIALEGSGGLTLNVTALAEWKVSQRLSIGINAGLPLVVRDVRPDGLTRQFVLAPQIAYQF